MTHVPRVLQATQVLGKWTRHKAGTDPGDGRIGHTTRPEATPAPVLRFAGVTAGPATSPPRAHPVAPTRHQLLPQLPDGAAPALPARAALQVMTVAASALEVTGAVRRVGRPWALDRLRLHLRRPRRTP